jgi:hypothetical protein
MAEWTLKKRVSIEPLPDLDMTGTAAAETEVAIQVPSVVADVVMA